MNNVIKFIWTILSFGIPLIGISLYFMYDNNRDAKLFGIIGVIGIFVYLGVGMGFI